MKIIDTLNLNVNLNNLSYIFSFSAYRLFCFFWIFFGVKLKCEEELKLPPSSADSNLMASELWMENWKIPLWLYAI